MSEDSGRDNELIIRASSHESLFLVVLVVMPISFIFVSSYLNTYSIIAVGIVFLAILYFVRKYSLNYLRLTPHGFTVRWFWREWVYYWDEVSEFRPYSSIAIVTNRAQPVLFQYSRNPLHDNKRRFAPQDGSNVLDAAVYDIDLLEFCDLLNEWRNLGLQKLEPVANLTR